MKRRGKHCRRGGMTLLLTLVVLIILSIIMVQFQADTAVHLRASSNRLERQQCRYAAESGIVIGAVMVADALREWREDRASLEIAEREGVFDIAELGQEQSDPNDGQFDPNEFDDDEEYFFERSYVLDEAELEFEEVSLEIEIHDENAKWPLIWLLRTPFTARGERGHAERSLRRFVEAVEADTVDPEEVMKLCRRIGGPLKLPESQVIVEVVKKSPKKLSRAAEARARRRRRRRRKGRRQRQANSIKRVALAPIFAEQWLDEVRRGPENADLREPLPVLPGAFSDYLGYWGAVRINLNSASAELLASAFGPLGLTVEQAEAIVARREVRPFTGLSQLGEVEGISDSLKKTILPLCVIEGEVFSLHVVARRGRTEVRLVGGVYISKGRVLSMGVVPGG